MVYFKTVRLGVVKKLIVSCAAAAFFLCGASFAGECEDFIRTVFDSSPLYRSALLEYKNAGFALLPYKYGRLPQPFFNAGYGASMSGNTASSPTQLFKASFALVQDIPGGIDLQAQVDQFFAVGANGAGMNSYEFAASIALNLPFYAAAPDTCAFALAGQGASFALSEDIRNLEFNIAKKRILAEAVYAVGNCLLLKERIELEEKRQNLIRKEAEADEKLWLLGRLSTFDLSERNTKRFESYVSLLQMRQNLSHLVENLYMFGLEETSLPSDAALWIACWEAYAAENPIENGLNSALESKQAEKNFYNETERHFADLPVLRFSASAEPAGRKGVSNSFKDSFMQYWKSGTKWNWDFKIALSLPLSPASPAYSRNALSLNSQRLYELSQQQLFKRREAQEKQYQTNLYLLKKLSEKALLDKTDAGNKVVAARALAEQERLTATDFEYQILNAALAENAYKEVRLRIVAALLNGY